MTFVVPAGVPRNLYYQCEVHSSMSGRMTFNGAAAAAVSALLLLLALLF